MVFGVFSSVPVLSVPSRPYRVTCDRRNFAFENPADDHVKNRHKENGQQSCRNHAADNAGTHVVAADRARIGADGHGHHAG